MNECAVVSMKSICKGNAMAIVTMGRSCPHLSYLNKIFFSIVKMRNFACRFLSLSRSPFRFC